MSLIDIPEGEAIDASGKVVPVAAPAPASENPHAKPSGNANEAALSSTTRSHASPLSTPGPAATPSPLSTTPPKPATTTSAQPEPPQTAPTKRSPRGSEEIAAAAAALPQVRGPRPVNTPSPVNADGRKPSPRPVPVPVPAAAATTAGGKPKEPAAVAIDEAPKRVQDIIHMYNSRNGEAGGDYRHPTPTPTPTPQHPAGSAAERQRAQPTAKAHPSPTPSSSPAAAANSTAHEAAPAAAAAKAQPLSQLPALRQQQQPPAAEAHGPSPLAINNSNNNNNNNNKITSPNNNSSTGNSDRRGSGEGQKQGPRSVPKPVAPPAVFSSVEVRPAVKRSATFSNGSSRPCSSTPTESSSHRRSSTTEDALLRPGPARNTHNNSHGGTAKLAPLSAPNSGRGGSAAPAAAARAPFMVDSNTNPDNASSELGDVSVSPGKPGTSATASPPPPPLSSVETRTTERKTSTEVEKPQPQAQPQQQQQRRPPSVPSLSDIGEEDRYSYGFGGEGTLDDSASPSFLMDGNNSPLSARPGAPPPVLDLDTHTPAAALSALPDDDPFLAPRELDTGVGGGGGGGNRPTSCVRGERRRYVSIMAPDP